MHEFPGMTGMTTNHWTRTRFCNRHWPVILLSQVFRKWQRRILRRSRAESSATGVAFSCQSQDACADASRQR